MSCFIFYEVDHIIRIGTAGAIRADLKLRDVVAGMGSLYQFLFCKTISVARRLCAYCQLSHAANRRRYGKTARNRSDRRGIYIPPILFMMSGRQSSSLAEDGSLAVEMEAAALYMNAALSGKEALAILYDFRLSVDWGEQTPEERQSSFTQMMEIALQTAVRL